MTVNFKYHQPQPVEQPSLLAQHPGQCHCGGVRFSVQLEGGFQGFARCNCSLCRRRGAVMGFVEMDRLQITAGQELLTLYQFNSNVARHYFCSRCGVYTHHQRRSVPTQYAVNIACLEEVDPFAVADVPIIDGAGGHPSDGR